MTPVPHRRLHPYAGCGDEWDGGERKEGGCGEEVKARKDRREEKDGRDCLEYHSISINLVITINSGFG